MQPKERTQDYQNATWAARWLIDTAEQQTPRPFFLACGIFRPHLNGSEELYDHQNDPQEWTNPADNPEYREITTELRKVIPEVKKEE